MGIVDEAIGTKANKRSIVDEALTSTAIVGQEEDGFIGNVWEDFKSRGRNIINEGMTPIRQNVLTEGPQKILRMAGEAGGFVADVGMEGVKSAYGMLVPNVAKRGITAVGKYLAGTDIGKAQIETAKDIGGIYSKAKLVAPESMKNIEAGLNIAGGGATLKMGKPLVSLGKEGVAVAGDVGRIVNRKSVESLETLKDAVIKKGISKGIRPTVVGKRSSGQIAKYHRQAKEAVETIVNEFPDKIPKNLDEFSQVITETKKRIYDKYSNITKAAGKANVNVNISGAKRELQSIAAATNTPLSVKNAAKRTLKEISAYDDIIDPSKAEDLVTHLNALSKPFWANPNPYQQPMAAMFERAARNVRGSINEAIQSFGGEEYVSLKKAHGALQSIEKDVAHRNIVASRANAKNLFDLVDVASSAEFATGIMTLNPVSIVKAGVIKTSKEYLKRQNNPDRIIDKMFSKVKKIEDRKVMAGQPQGASLRSSTMKRADELLSTTKAKAEGKLSPSVDAPLQYPPVVSKTMRMPEDVSKLNEAEIIRLIDEKRAARSSAELPVLRERTINLPRDIEKSNALDRLIAKKEAAPWNETARLERQAGTPILESAPTPEPTIRSAVDYDRVILPAIMNAFKGKLPTWVEDRLQYLRTVSPASWTADDQLMIRRLQKSIPTGKGYIPRPSESGVWKLSIEKLEGNRSGKTVKLVKRKTIKGK